MNRTQAIAKLRPILGKHLAWRQDDDALTGDDLEAAGDEALRAQVAYTAAKEACDARRAAILAGDAEYQRLRAASIAAYEAQGRASGRCHRRRVTVGTTGGEGVAGMFFHVRAEGDNWQEVVDKLTKK